MKVVITGTNGQLGNLLLKRLSSNYEIVGLNSRQLDIGQEAQVFEAISSIKPQYIINCAAYNNVNQAEINISDAKYVNELGVYNLARAAELVKATLVHISTDYVFDGQKRQPYVEEDIPHPLNMYGITKYSGEKLAQQVCSRCLIIRTSWLYSEKTNNFVHTIMKLATERNTVKVISDHVGTPTNAEELAEIIEQLIENNATGLYHASGGGVCSWYDFARKIIDLANISCDIQPISYKDYKELAVKPCYSVLSKDKLEKEINYKVANWQETLEKYFASDKK